MSDDLTIEINFDVEESGEEFEIIHDYYQLFNDLINSLQYVSSYGIKMRGKYLSEWIEHSDWEFKRSLNEIS